MLISILYNLPFLCALFCILSVIAIRRPAQSIIRKALLIYLVDFAILLFTHAAAMQYENGLYLFTRPLFVLSLVTLYPLYYINIRLTTLDRRLKTHYYWILAPGIILALATFVIINEMTPEEFNLAQLYEQTRNSALLTPSIFALYVVDVAVVVAILLELAGMVVGTSLAIIRYKRQVHDYYADAHDKVKGLMFDTIFISIIGVITVCELLFAYRELYDQNIWLHIFTVATMLLPMLLLTFRSQTRQFTVMEFEQEKSTSDRIYETVGKTVKFKKSKKNNSNAQEQNVTHNTATIQSQLNTHHDDINELEELDNINIDSQSDEDKQTVEVNIAYIAERIVEVIEIKKLYLKPDLRITDVCDILSTNRTYISQAINTHLGGNFSDFINRYRLEESKRLLGERSNDNFTIESLATQAGFSTAASMNRTFRKIEGVTPHKYRQNSMR